MDKLKMHSPDLTAKNVERIAELFPTVVTEHRDENGSLIHAVDFDLLRQELSDHIVDGPRERYQLDWPGKRASLFAANAPIAKTLRPSRDDSIEFEKTRNIVIEGDNLDALKLLQEAFLGRVKLIYIDPPYNTGGDFIYSDDFAVESSEYLRISQQIDDAGERTVSNLESNGRFHSDWLSMIYPRLRLARTVLRDDGVLFVSCDDHERDNLKHLLDEVFGEDCFVAAIIWRKKSSPDARSTIGAVHDYILCYVRRSDQAKEAVGKMDLSEKRLKSFSNPDNDPRGPWASVDMTAMTGRATADQYFTVISPSGREIQPPEGRSWGLVEKTFNELRADNRIWFGRGGDNVPRMKRFLSEAEGQTVPSVWDHGDVGSNQDATDEVRQLFDGKRVFDTPKPVRLMRRLLQIGTQATSEDIVLDFFAGSASMAEAVLEANAEDGGNRRFLLVQAAEETATNSEAAKAGYRAISEVARERIVRALYRIRSENESATAVDGGFRYLRIDSTNMMRVLSSPDQTEQPTLSELTDSVKPDRTPDDIVLEIMLSFGLDPSLPIVVEQLAGQDVHVVADGALIACFGSVVGGDLTRAMAEREPLRVVFRDSGFRTDADRINAEQIFAEISPSTDVKVI